MGRRKLIIDTDPGVDDALAIFMAFNTPDVEVLGLTTIFGNVTTPMATANALHLCEMAKRTDVPVAQASRAAAPLAQSIGPPLSLTRTVRRTQGALGPLTGGVTERIADFVHGSDGARPPRATSRAPVARAPHPAPHAYHRCRGRPTQAWVTRAPARLQGRRVAYPPRSL